MSLRLIRAGQLSGDTAQTSGMTPGRRHLRPADRVAVAVDGDHRDGAGGL